MFFFAGRPKQGMSALLRALLVSALLVMEVQVTCIGCACSVATLDPELSNEKH